VALDAETGQRIWKTYAISEQPTRRGVNSLGTALFAPAGGAIWGSPTIDTRRHLLYVGTGNGYTVPAAPTTDSILAIALETGRIMWSYQATRDDSWIVACFFDHEREPCPPESGPDFDFGSSPILQHVAGGHELILGAHKGGILIALDPARSGTVLWQRTLASATPSASGEFLFGGAADGQHAYFGFMSGGIAAVDLKSGNHVWWTALTGASPNSSHIGQSAALTTIPGVVFSGGLDGVLRAFSTRDGHEIWHVETAHPFTTVNGVTAHGGSMGAPGAVIVDGMLYVGSGYIGTHNGMPGNVLLAFAP
jgi:polyvinyl alcohol dehydrogenase (cytochrome)